MLMNSEFWPNGPYTEGQPPGTVPAITDRTTENQICLWGAKSFDTVKSELRITDDADVPPLLKAGDVLIIEDVTAIEPQSRYYKTFTVCDDVPFHNGTASTGPSGGSATALKVVVKISPSINPGRENLGDTDNPYLVNEDGMSLENFQNVTRPPTKGSKVYVLCGLESLTEYKVEYACPKSAIALSVMPGPFMQRRDIKTPFIGDVLIMPNSITGNWHAPNHLHAIKRDPSSGLNFGMSFQYCYSLEAFEEMLRFASIYGVDVISPEHCIKHFVKAPQTQ